MKVVAVDKVIKAIMEQELLGKRASETECKEAALNVMKGLSVMEHEP